MMKYLRLLFLPAILSCLLPATAQAQDKPRPPVRNFEPETRQASDVLPALDLPEYVITGSDMISFTEDRKTTLSWPDNAGFTARAGRGIREQRFFGTEPTRMPLRKRALTGSEEVFRLKAGIGTWSTPHLQAWYADRYQLGDLASHVLYERSDGHVPRADYSRFNFDIDAGTYLPRNLTPLLASSRIQGAFHARVHEYGLYADKLQQDAPALDFRRSLTQLDWQADLISRRNTILDHSLSLFFRHTGVDEQLAVRDTMDLEDYSSLENRIGLDGTATLRVPGYRLETSGGIHVNDLSEAAEGSTRPFFMHAGAATIHRFDVKNSLDVRARLYLFRGSMQATQLRLYPTILFRHRLTDDWQLHAGYAPEVQERSFADFMHLNPYMMLASEIRHTDIPLRFEAAAEWDNRHRSSARIIASYSSSSSIARFSLLPDPVRQQWALHYDGNSSMLDLRGDLAHAFSTATRIQGSALFRSTHNDVVDGSIPYMPSYELRLMLQHSFPFDLTLQASTQLAGGQVNSDGADIPAWLILGFECEYRLTDYASLFLRVDNLLDQSYEQWDDYRERPFFMMGGAVLRF
ncbi:hypothetical protein KQI65_05055 [bacterium]|nr:hypothetical protein [bacterium]